MLAARTPTRSGRSYGLPGSPAHPARSAGTILAVVSGAAHLGTTHRLLAALVAPPLAALLVSAWLSHRELVPDVAPKQAWTPVAQFAEQGIDAINYGPGATPYAHKVDEQIPVANLEQCFTTLRAFLDSV